MPTVPGTAAFDAPSGGGMLAQRPSPENLLMAAADLHRQGRLIAPEPEVKMPKGQQTPKVQMTQRSMKHKLKVVK